MFSWIRSTLLLFVLLSYPLHAYELAIATLFKNEAPYLKEWIEYHHMVGVEHFWMYDNGSTDTSLEVLQPYVAKGLVDIISLPTPEGIGGYVREQVAAFENGILLAREKNFKWIALIDIDEFLMPMDEKSVVDVLNKYFSDSSAIYISWRNFGTGGVFIAPGDPLLCQLTACSLAAHSDNCIGKSIVRPECVPIAGVICPHYFLLVPDAYYTNGDANPIKLEGLELKIDGKHHNQHLCLHHYVLRDEGYYQRVRLPKARQGLADHLQVLEEHYTSFSLMQYPQMPNFIKTNYPDMHEKIWKQ